MVGAETSGTTVHRAQLFWCQYMVDVCIDNAHLSVLSSGEDIETYMLAERGYGTQYRKVQRRSVYPHCCTGGHQIFTLTTDDQQLVVASYCSHMVR